MNAIPRFFAYFFSIVFHPLLILTYMLVLHLAISPYLFGASVLNGKDIFVLLVFSSTFLIPAFAVFLMSALGLVSSIELKEKNERIGPYILTGVFYLWIYINILHNPDVSFGFKVSALGATIGLFVAFFVNLFSKISMHAVGVGGLLGMVIITMLQFSYDSFAFNIGANIYQLEMNTLLMLVILICGGVGTSRLFLGAHQPRDLYGGFVIGFGTQFLALTILS